MKKTLTTAALLALGTLSTNAAIAITEVVKANGNNTTTTSIDGTGADKLVVFVTGEIFTTRSLGSFQSQ